jgi:hypothetical protein
MRLIKISAHSNPITVSGGTHKEIAMKKRKDECLFCTIRSCYERVVSSDDAGKTYDEISCPTHLKDLHKHSDLQAPGIMKYFISSTGKLKRGCAF